MLNISCKFLDTVLKVGNKMVVWVQMVVSESVVDPRAGGAGWKLQLAALSSTVGECPTEFHYPRK